MLLNTQMFSGKIDCPSDVLHIFATNKEADKLNHDALSALNPTITHGDAEEHINNDWTGQMTKHAVPF